ncbi:protein rep [Streptomyces sp. NPDC006925]|uniref:protein rep n=1 Tax=Streptomyces sp. NPDC006925 TaxID=3364768 RepID=UPI00367960E9
MTSVPTTADAVPARGPRCHCGATITHTPGKRPKVYCSPRCRMAAKRAIARGAALPTTTAEARPAEAKANRRLGTTGETTTRAGQSPVPAAGEAKADTTGTRSRDGRWTLREGLQRVTADKGLKGCGRSAIAGGVGVVLNGQTAHLSGVATCGKIHLCPVCSAKIRAARSEEIDTVTGAWQAAGHGLAMMTLTLRHYRRMPLGTTRKRERGGLVGVQHDAWITAFGARAGKMWQRLQTEHGIVGYVRVWECTVGPDHGWHPHFHVLLFTSRPWTRDRADAFEAAARARWVRSVERAGGYRPNDRGVKVDVPRPEDAQQFSRYLFKNQDGKARFEKWTPGAELARADLKTGRRAARMPFEVAEGAAAGLADDVPLWHEYEYAAHGIRAAYWSNGLRALLAELVELDDRTDEEIAAEEIGGDGVALIPAETWHSHVVRHRGRSLDLIRAAESGGVPAVRALVAEWGLVWGRDVLPAPDPDDDQTA